MVALGLVVDDGTGQGRRAHSHHSHTGIWFVYSGARVVPGAAACAEQNQKNRDKPKKSDCNVAAGNSSHGVLNMEVV